MYEAVNNARCSTSAYSYTYERVFNTNERDHTVTSNERGSDTNSRPDLLRPTSSTRRPPRRRRFYFFDFFRLLFVSYRSPLSRAPERAGSSPNLLERRCICSRSDHERTIQMITRELFFSNTTIIRSIIYHLMIFSCREELLVLSRRRVRVGGQDRQQSSRPFFP